MGYSFAHWVFVCSDGIKLRLASDGKTVSILLWELQRELFNTKVIYRSYSSSSLHFLITCPVLIFPPFFSSIWAWKLWKFYLLVQWDWNCLSNGRKKIRIYRHIWYWCMYDLQVHLNCKYMLQKNFLWGSNVNMPVYTIGRWLCLFKIELYC